MERSFGLSSAPLSVTWCFRVLSVAAKLLAHAPHYLLLTVLLLCATFAGYEKVISGNDLEAIYTGIIGFGLGIGGRRASDVVIAKNGKQAIPTDMTQ